MSSLTALGVMAMLFISACCSFVLGMAIGAERERERIWLQHHKAERNPQYFCPDCGADLGKFYSNRIRMEPRP